MAIPVFSGEDDAYGWVLDIDKFFAETEISSSSKLLMAVSALQGPPLQWWLQWSHLHLMESWESFIHPFLWHFKPEWRPILPGLDEEEDPDSELFIGDVTDSITNYVVDEEDEPTLLKSTEASSLNGDSTVDDFEFNADLALCVGSDSITHSTLGSFTPSDLVSDGFVCVKRGLLCQSSDSNSNFSSDMDTVTITTPETGVRSILSLMASRHPNHGFDPGGNPNFDVDNNVTWNLKTDVPSSLLCQDDETHSSLEPPLAMLFDQPPVPPPPLKPPYGNFDEHVFNCDSISSTKFKSESHEVVDLLFEYGDSSSNSDLDPFPCPIQESSKNFYFHNDKHFGFVESHLPLRHLGNVVFSHVMNKSISNTLFHPGPLSFPPSTTTMSLALFAHNYFVLFAHNYFVHGTVIFNLCCQMNYLNGASKVFDQMPNRDFIFLYLPRETIFTLSTSLQHVGKMTMNTFSVMLLADFMFLFDPGGTQCRMTNLLLKIDDEKARVATYKECWPPINGDECFDVDIHAALDMAIQSFFYDGESDKNIELWKIKNLIKALEAARGNDTSRISMIIPPHDQISRVTKMLGDEYETASNIKSRVNWQFVLGAITSTQQRLKLYNKVPLNGLVLYTSTSFTDDGREKKVTINFEPFQPINASLYPCDIMLHTETLNELLESDEKFGFIIMDGNGTLFGTLSELSDEILSNVKCIQEKHLIGKYFEEMSQETGKYVYGVLSYMQVLSTCFMSFAHGGNDVSHVICLLAGALAILQGAAKEVELVISIDVIAWGGFGIVAGLMIWGYRVITKIVKKITELMSTRGFAAEFAVVSLFCVFQSYSYQY